MSLILPLIGAFGYIPAAGGGSPTQIGTIPSALAASTAGQSISLASLSLQENDFVIIHFVQDNAFGSSPVTTTGYADIHQAWASGAPSYGSSYKFMGSTPDTAIVADGGGKIAPYVVEAWRGVHTSDPFGGVASTDSASSTPTALNTTYDNMASIIVHFLDDDDVAGSGGAPSGWTGLVESDTGQASTVDGSTVSVAYQIMGAAGTVTPGAFTGLSTDTERTRHFALRAAT